MTQKIIFWITGPDLHFFIAYKLQKLLDAELFAIYEIPQRNFDFFKRQKFVNFKNTWNYYTNIKKDQIVDLKYLSDFETKYDVDLWKLVLNERYFKFNDFYHFSKDEILSILTQECKLFEKIISEIKPDFFLTYDTPFHFNRLFYELCRNQGIKVLMFQSSRLSNKCMISENPQKLPPFHFEIKSKNKLDTFEKLQNYLKAHDYSKQIKENFIDVPQKKSNTLTAFFDYITANNTITQTHYSYYGRNKISVLLKKIIIELKGKYRKRFIDSNLIKTIKNDNFILFPLHMDIEQYPLIISPFFTNQIEIIKNIAKSIPIDHFLYVKEHPAQYTRGWRTISDYKELMNIPNVKVIHPYCETDNLYKNCSLVISIAGTASFEAAFFGKPSILFSDMFFDSLPSVSKVKSIDELPKVINHALKNIPNPSDVNNFIDILESISFDFNNHEFFSKISNSFYLNGNNSNVPITDLQMTQFLSENDTIIQQIALEHIKRIKMYENTK